MSTIKIESLDKIHEAAKEFIAGMDDRTVFALNQYDKQPERISLNNTRQIVGFRNRIIHAYDSLDDTLVWAIVVNHLPALKSEVKTLLENC